MDDYRIIEVGCMHELYEIARDIETVRPEDTVARFTAPDDAEPAWLE